MFDSELAKKFLSKIEAMTFEELDERASRAPSIGIEGLVENLPTLELLYEEIIEASFKQDVIQLFSINNKANNTNPEIRSRESFSFEISSNNEPEYAAAA